MISENTLEKSDFYLTARIDRIFKSIFVDPHDTRFMNAILSEALEQPVKVLEFFPTELPVRNKFEKVKVLDVLLQTKDGKHINVEVNTCFDEAMRIRNFTYFTSYYSQKVSRVMNMILLVNLSKLILILTDIQKKKQRKFMKF